MTITQTAYPHDLPPAALVPGDASRGEIELVMDPETVQAIRRQRKRVHGPERQPLGVVFEDEYMIVVRDPVSFPSGAVGTYLRVFPRPALTGAAGAVMLPLRDGNVLLRRVFRHATRSWELECPRGFRNSGADVLDTVQNEVVEELGLSVLSITPLGKIYGDTGLLAGHTEGFAVTVAHGEAAAAPDESEAIGDLEILAPPRLVELLAAGEIRDGFTLSVITLAQARGILTLSWLATPDSAEKPWPSSASAPT